MGFQDVSFLPSKASFSTTFPKNCNTGESLRTTTYNKTVVGGKQGHAPCKILLVQQILFSCQLNLMEIIKLSESWGESGHH